MSISEEEQGTDEMDPTSDNEADFAVGSSGEGGKTICFMSKFARRFFFINVVVVAYHLQYRALFLIRR